MAEPMTPPGANPPSPGMDNYPAIDPAATTVIEGVEHKLDSMLQRDVHVYLWVDINGLKIIDKKSKHVQWSARLNTIVQWAVRDDYFWCRMIYKKGEQRERGFLTGYSKAVQLKAAMETFVNIHLKDPELATQLMMNAEDPITGHVVPDKVLMHAMPLEAGKYRDPDLARKYLKKKGAVIEAAAKPNGAADLLPENAPPPWVLTPGGTASGHDERIHAIMAQNDELSLHLEAHREEIERLTQQLSEKGGGDVDLVKENSELQMKVKELQAAAAAAPPAEAASHNVDEQEQAWVAEKKVLKEEQEVLIKMMTEKEEMTESLMEKVAHLEKALEEAAAGSGVAADAAAAAARAQSEAAVAAAEQAVAAARAEAAAATEAAEAAQSGAVERAARTVKAVSTAARRMQSATADLQAMKAEVAEKTLAMQAELPGMFEVMVEQVKDFLASENMASLKEMRQLYQDEMALRKKLHNELVDLKGNIRVYCRVRPLLDAEDGEGEAGPVVRFPVGDEKITLKNGSRDDKTFTYEKVFQPRDDQPAVFAEISALITSVMDGYNVTIFAYGQTGSGKTYTMAGTQSNPGVNIRALQELFEIAQQRSGENDTRLNASYLEIYNENIFDLLSKERESLTVKHAGGAGIEVAGLTVHSVSSVAEVQQVLDLGDSNRSTFATNMNEHSSRSHSMLSIVIESTNTVTGQSLRGKLNLVDLAGSERLSRTDATGDRLKEAQNINKSLSALGDVIASLAKKDKHTPFRNSKLTQVLQDSMEGSAKVAMFVNISPTAESAGESVCSLNFAARVRGVELGAAGQHSVGASDKKARPATARPGLNR